MRRFSCAALVLLVLPLLLEDTAMAGRREAASVLKQTLDAYEADRDAIAARDGFLRALSLDPTYPNPRFDLAVLAERTYRWAEATKWFESFLEVAPPDSVHVEYAKRRLVLCRAAAEMDNSPDTGQQREYAEAMSRALTALRSNDSRKAFIWAAQAAAIDERAAESYVIAAAALVDIGAYQPASAMVEQGIARSTTDTQRRQLQALRAKIDGRSGAPSP